MTFTFVSTGAARHCKRDGCYEVRGRMTATGRVQLVMTDWFRAAHLQGLLWGGELGKWSVKCRP